MSHQLWAFCCLELGFFTWQEFWLVRVSNPSTASTWLIFKTCPHKHCTLKRGCVVGFWLNLTGHFPHHSSLPVNSRVTGRVKAGQEHERCWEACGNGLQLSGREGVWLLDVTSLRASLTPAQMPLRDGHSQALQPLWLLANHPETKNQDLILLSPQKARWLGSGAVWVSSPWVGQVGLFEGRLGGGQEPTVPSWPWPPSRPHKTDLQNLRLWKVPHCENVLFPEFSLQDWVTAVNWSRELGLASSYAVETSVWRR